MVTVEPSSDNDNDGRSALVEFAMGTNPSVFERESEILKIEVLKDGEKEMLQVSIDKNPRAQGVTLLAEWSNDLSQWGNDEVLSSTETKINDDGTVIKKVTFSIEVNDDLKKPVFFLELKLQCLNFLKGLYSIF